MRVRIQSYDGWNEHNKQTVLAVCKRFNLVFVDRAKVADADFPRNGIRVIHECLNDWLSEGGSSPKRYAFFTHRHLFDLPFDCTVTGSANLNTAEKTLQSEPMIVECLLALRHDLSAQGEDTLSRDDILARIDSCLFGKYGTSGEHVLSSPTQ